VTGERLHLETTRPAARRVESGEAGNHPADD
jgi:hypothetical protein